MRGGSACRPSRREIRQAAATHHPRAASAQGILPCMSAGHAYELPVEEPDAAVAEALAEVQAGQIAYLTRAGQPIAALVPPGELTALQHAADAHAIAEAHAVAARPGPQIPHVVLEAMMTADDATHDAMAAALDAHAEQTMSADEVVALWEMINTRRG